MKSPAKVLTSNRERITLWDMGGVLATSLHTASSRHSSPMAALYRALGFPWVRILILAAVFYILTHLKFESILPLDRPTAQIMAFPFFIYFVFKFTWGTLPIPKLVLVFASLGALFGGVVTFGPPPSGRATFLVAKFPNDELEIAGSLFRERLRRNLNGTGISSVRYFNTPRSPWEVEKIVEERNDSRPMIWGNTRWLQLGIPSSAEIPGDSRTDEEIKKFFGFEVVSSVPLIGLSYEPVVGTSSFLALLFDAILHRTNEEYDQVREVERISILEQAAGLTWNWTSYAHRAYPLFLVGNHYLREGFRAGRGTGELECALNTYTRARKMLAVPANNAELYAAILNNAAIAEWILGNRIRSVEKAKSSIRLFHAASKAVSIKNGFGVRFDAPLVARANVARFMDRSAKQHKKRVKTDRSTNGRR